MHRMLSGKNVIVCKTQVTLQNNYINISGAGPGISYFSVVLDEESSPRNSNVQLAENHWLHGSESHDYLGSTGRHLNKNKVGWIETCKDSRENLSVQENQGSVVGNTLTSKVPTCVTLEQWSKQKLTQL